MKTPRLKNALKCAAIATVGVTVLAACGGDSASGGDSSGGSSSEPIKIMTINVWDTPNAPDTRFQAQMLENDANALNDSGGIGGRDVEVISCNGSLDPNKAQQCARQAIEENVAAIVGGGSIHAAKFWPILGTKKIPWIAHYAAAPIDNTDPQGFSVIGGSLLWTAPTYLAGTECERPALLVAGDRVGETNMGYAEAGLKAAGAEWATTVNVQATATDMTAPVAAIAQADPDCMVVEILDPVQWTQTIQQYEQQGLMADGVRVYSVQPGSVTADLLQQFPEQTNGFILAGYFPDIHTNEAWESYVDVQTEAGNLDEHLANIGDSSETRQHVGFEVFRTVAETIDGTIDGAAMTEALNKSCNVDVGEIAPVLNFCEEQDIPELKRVFNTEFVYYKVENSELTPYQDGFEDMLPVYEEGTGQG